MNQRNQNSFMTVMTVSVKSLICKCLFVSIRSLNRAGTWVTHPVLVTRLIGWKQVLSPAANILAVWRSTCFSLQGSFEVDCWGVGELSLGLPYPNRGSLVLSLVMCIVGLCTEATAPTGGEILPSQVFTSSLVDFPSNVHCVDPGTLCWLWPV